MLSQNLTAFENGYFLQGTLPVSLATLNDAAKPRLEFGSGLGVDAWLWKRDAYLFGLGAGFYGSLPFKTGNLSVRVNPYTFYLEPRFNLAYLFKSDIISIMPFIALKSHLGIAHYRRHVKNSFSKNTDFLFALGPSLGAIFLIKRAGFTIAYSPLYGTKGFRQQFEIAIALCFSFI